VHLSYEFMPSGSSRDRIDIVNALRAFAAVFVAWGHFCGGQGRWLSWSGLYGYTGVDIFFVISGFIIPYSLFRGKYTLRNFGRFVLKRSIRLYPPYLISIPISIFAANIVLRPISPAAGIHVGGRQLLYHLLFVNDIVGVPWINVVYWTLAIEWEWYLLAGLFFGMLVSRNAFLRFCPVVAAMVAYFLVPNDRLIFHTLPIFLIGVFVFQHKIGIIGNRRLLALIAVMLWSMRGPTGWIVAWIAVATGLLIAFVSFRHPIADFLGDVSYSVYLLHLPIGVGLISWLSHLLPFSGSYIGVLDCVGMAAAIGAAAVLYRWVEKPAQELSSRVRFVRADRRDLALAAAAAK
jgi:peptidoglycan/LPS O-acetylase OafA/YrhL